MNPLGVFQLVLLALEGVAHAVNPNLRKESRKSVVGFGAAYVGILLVGSIIVGRVVWSLYFSEMNTPKPNHPAAGSAEFRLRLRIQSYLPGMPEPGVKRVERTMKIHADKIESAPRHGLDIRDVRLILKQVPTPWTEGLKEVRLSNSLTYGSPYAFFSRYDGCLTIYSRCGTKRQAVIAVLSALAAPALGMNRGIGRRRAEAEKGRLSQAIAPLVEQLMPVMEPDRSLNPKARGPWRPLTFSNESA